MKYLPIGIMAVSLISGYTLLQARVSTAESDIKDQKNWLLRQSQDTGEIKISEAKVQATQQAMLETLKDIKESLRR